MEKILIITNEDLENAINYFGIEWKSDIKKVVTKLPCILVGKYDDDIGFVIADNYTFDMVTIEDFSIREPGKSW